MTILLLKELDLHNQNYLTADNSNLSYMGRIDFSKPSNSCFIWAGSSVSCRFTGTEIRCALKNYHFYGIPYVGYVLDGVQGKFELEQGEDEVVYTLASNLSQGEHELILFKRKDASHYFDFLGLILSQGGEILCPPQKPKRKIEVFGDSVSAGAVVEAVYYTAHADPEDNNGQYDNAWFSYSMSLARKLNAQIHNTSQGGIALFDNTGYFGSGETLGLLSCYDKLRYEPGRERTDWDFNRYTPNVVIMAIGQNDAHPNPDCIDDIEYKNRWKSSYKELLCTLHGHYPNATFVLITTVLMHSPKWDDALDEVAQEMADNRVKRFKFIRNGSATPGHPRISEEEEMAMELFAYLNNFGEEIWQ